jgi:poly(A) polymerase
MRALTPGTKAPNRKALGTFGSWINSYCREKYGRPLVIAASADLAGSTIEQITDESGNANSPAPERVNHELTLIMQSARAGDAFKAMYETGVLKTLIPEVEELAGVEQPGFHHLDVLEHCLTTLESMDLLVKDPAIKFPVTEPFYEWLKEHRKLVSPLKWAALTHDFGKPRKKALKGNRVTFYNHDAESAAMVEKLARRLRWPRRDTVFTSLLVRLHMRPFHLLTPFRQERLTKRAMTRLLRKTGANYPALFMLAMADSMAGCGPLKPDDLDDTLAALAARVHEYFKRHFQPAATTPRLFTGHDIMSTFNLPPGPLIGKLLAMLDDYMVEEKISSRNEAECLIRQWIKDLT